MIFDDVREMKKKKNISKNEKCKFLSQVPDCTISMHIEPGRPDLIAKSYTDDDIEELFDYWFGVYQGMTDKDGYLWQ